jgi:hypothetical protein
MRMIGVREADWGGAVVGEGEKEGGVAGAGEAAAVTQRGHTHNGMGDFCRDASQLVAKELVIGWKGIFRTPKMLTYRRCAAPQSAGQFLQHYQISAFFVM